MVSVNRTVVPCLNCTDAIVPSGSVAVAVKGTVAGPVKVAPFVGEVSETVGD